jgi:hypothetical protein
MKNTDRAARGGAISLLAGALALAAGCASSADLGGDDDLDGAIMQDASRVAFVHLFEW